MLQALSDFITKVTRGEKIRIDGAEAQWKKAAELTPGMMIAVPAADVAQCFEKLSQRDEWDRLSEDKDNFGSGTSDVLWDEIVAIRRLPPEKVYDIEVEGTHNFIAGHLIETPLPKTDRIINDEPLRGPPDMAKWSYGYMARNTKNEQYNNITIEQYNHKHKWYGGIFAHNTYINGDLNTISGGFGKYQNALTYSEAFDNSAWTKSANTTVPATNITAPNTASTADQIRFAANAATDEIYQATGSTAGSNTFTGSVWLKYTSATTVRIGLRDQAGTPSTTTSTASVTTSWQRFSVSKTFSAATGNVVFFIDDAASSAQIDVYAWGAQVEQASAMNQYAATSASAVGSTTSVGLVASGSGPHQFAFGGAGVPIISFGDTATTSKASIRTSGGSANSILNLQSSTGAVELSDGTSLYKLDIYNAGTLGVELLSSGTSFLNGGAVGIGTTAPGQRLTVQQTSVDDILGVMDGANNTNFLVDDGGVSSFKPTAFDTVFYYNGTTYTTNTTEAKTTGGTAFTILSGTTDYFYVGLDHKFATSYFDVATAGAGVTLAAQYSQGSGAWATLTLTDNTSNLSQDGSITWTAPSDWATDTVNGAGSTYWVRFRTTTAASTAPTGNSVSPTTGTRFYVYSQSGDSTAALYVSDRGEVQIDNAGKATGTALVVGNGTGKIDVGTIDPPYTINGEKYATYLPGMTGVKEETTGKIELKIKNEKLKVYEYVIDFNQAEKGSDLWLFSKTTDLKNNIDKMVVLLTPSANTRAWYTVDKSKMQLIIYSIKPTAIAYRLTAPRFDSEKFKNARDSETLGHVINDKEAEVSLDQNGDIAADYLPRVSDLTFLSATPSAVSDIFYELRDKTGSLVGEVGIFADAAIANLRSGFISARQIVGDLGNLGNLTVSEKLVSPVIESEKITAKDLEATGSASFGQILVKGEDGQTVALIDSSGNISTSGNLTAQEASFSGQLSSDSLLSDLGNLGTLNVSGDTTVSGTLYADRIQSADLDSLRSSFGNILTKLDQLDKLDKSATSSANQPTTDNPQPTTVSPTETPTPTPTANLTPTATPSPTILPAPTPTVILENEVTPGSTDSGQARMTITDNSEATDSSSLLARLTSFLNDTNSLNDKIEEFIATSSSAISDSHLPHSSAVELSDNIQLDKLDQLDQLKLKSLAVIGSASLADTSIAGSLLVDANLLLENNQISSLSDTLSLTSQDDINFFGGKMIVDKNGNLTVEGTLTAQGGIVTNEISSNNGNLTIDLDQKTSPQSPLLVGEGEGEVSSFGKLLVIGNTEVTNDLRVGDSLEVAGSASVSGTLTAAKLNFSNLSNESNLTNSSILLTAADNFLQNGINAPAARTTGAAGSATLPAGALDLYIYNDNITDKSLVYITPTSPTQNRTLYVSGKNSCDPQPTTHNPQPATNCHKHFVISLDTPVAFDIKFNWWLIN